MLGREGGLAWRVWRGEEMGRRGEIERWYVRPVKSATVTMVPFSVSKFERRGVRAMRFRRRWMGERWKKGYADNRCTSFEDRQSRTTAFLLVWVIYRCSQVAKFVSDGSKQPQSRRLGIRRLRTEMENMERTRARVARGILFTYDRILVGFTCQEEAIGRHEALGVVDVK